MIGSSEQMAERLGKIKGIMLSTDKDSIKLDVIDMILRGVR